MRAAARPRCWRRWGARLRRSARGALGARRRLGLLAASDCACAVDGSRGELSGAVHRRSRTPNSEGPELSPPSPLSFRGTVKSAARRALARTGPRGSRVPRRRGRTVVALHVVICRAPDCGRGVLLCPLCDFEQARYCGPECRQSARRARQREFGARYQRSRRGRRKHALRQRRYVAQLRSRKKVTHQTAPDRLISGRVDSTSTPASEGPPRCARCGRCGTVMGPG